MLPFNKINRAFKGVGIWANTYICIPLTRSHIIRYLIYMNRTLILPALLIILLLSGCTRIEREEIISTYPGCQKKVTAIFLINDTEKTKIKSFEFYKTGMKKREYNYKDDHYYGDWTYWYKDGTVAAKGLFNEKTKEPFKGIGKGTYYWPEGKKMMTITIKKKKETKESSIVYYDKSGNSYFNENLPTDLRDNIHLTLSMWDRGEI